MFVEGHGSDFRQCDWVDDRLFVKRGREIVPPESCYEAFPL